MSTTIESLPRLLPPPTRPVRRAVAAPASIFLPKEHGSWSLAFEPLALGMVLAPSAAGVALLAAAMAGFFARRPLKAAFAAQHSERRRDARETVVLLLTLAMVAGFEVIVLGDPVALWPVLLALPCGLMFAYFDGQGEGRAAAAEVAGSAAFAMLPAVFATLAGWPPAAALSLAALALVRSVPAVLTIRTFLRQRKGEPASSLIPVMSAVIGLALLLQFAAAGAMPVAATVGAGVLLARTLWLVGPWRPAWSARTAGMVETALGLLYCGYLATVGLR
jgi:hypothetical protein